jgi:hypothetical protein
MREVLRPQLPKRFHRTVREHKVKWMTIFWLYHKSKAIWRILFWDWSYKMYEENARHYRSVSRTHAHVSSNVMESSRVFI